MASVSAINTAPVQPNDKSVDPSGSKSGVVSAQICLIAKNQAMPIPTNPVIRPLAIQCIPENQNRKINQKSAVKQISTQKPGSWLDKGQTDPID